MSKEVLTAAMEILRKNNCDAKESMEKMMNATLEMIHIVAVMNHQDPEQMMIDLLEQTLDQVKQVKLK